jgi:hypothetical protein
MNMDVSFTVVTESMTPEERHFAISNEAEVRGIAYTPDEWIVSLIASFDGGPYKWLVEDEASHDERSR